MKIDLVDTQGTVLLSVRTEHQESNSATVLPAQMVGSRELLLRPNTSRGNVSTLVALCNDAARRHGLHMVGDYMKCSIRDSLTL